MEPLKATPASRRARLWARLSDLDKLPRRWWFPLSSRRDEVLRMPEAARQGYRVVVQQAHEKFSETVRLAMLSLLGFALFCLMVIFSALDSAFLVADPTIKLPFADIPVSFQSFILLSPSLLIVIALYLHIFYGYWLDLETDYQHLTLGREPSDPPIEYLPTLFSLDHPVPRLLTAFIFYWLVPLVLVAITWKAAARLSWALPLALITGLVTAILVFIKIRRCPASQRQWNRPRWTMMAVIVTCIVAIIYNPQWLERRLNIYRVDFKGKWLAQRDLHSIDACLADLRDAILWGANLQDAILCGANLQGADLQGADLQRADLWGADLRWANLGHANLQNASFQGAFLSGADLRDAILQGANLGDADLQEVKGLTEQQILSARINGGTRLPNDLKRPVP